MPANMPLQKTALAEDDLGRSGKCIAGVAEPAHLEFAKTSDAKPGSPRTAAAHRRSGCLESCLKPSPDKVCDILENVVLLHRAETMRACMCPRRVPFAPCRLLLSCMYLLMSET